MAKVRSVDFLPEIFQTPTNRQFLSATLDQLVQEPAFKQTQGFIGRKVGPGVNPNDVYVVEPDATRADYQLEPGVISLTPGTRTISDAITYPGINDALTTAGGTTDNASRLYTSEYYTWDPFVNWDKFVNFSQYYWLPNGPNSVTVASEGVASTNTFNVTYNTRGYTIATLPGYNPPITLLRGGTYQFVVDQADQFWIQTNIGVDGKIPFTPNFSSRDVLGVDNNGAAVGTITFTVPSKTAQQFYYNLDSYGTVTLASDLTYAQLQGQKVQDIIDTYGGIDGVPYFDNSTIIFTDNSSPGTVWLLTYNRVLGEDYINLTAWATVASLNKFTILGGVVYSNSEWYLNAGNIFEIFPLLSAVKDILYYQDGTDPEAFGEIRLVDQAASGTVNVYDILGKAQYISPNGVTFTNNLKVVFRGDTYPASYQDQTYYVAGVGTAIKLLPVGDYIVPETYVTTDGSTDPRLKAPQEQDYLTISLDSLSLNPWSRSNRWFHIDVINATAEYNNTVAVLDNQYRGKRPILEYYGNLKLYNFGTQGKAPVDVIDFQQSDAMSNINGTIGYAVDGYLFDGGTRVIFANDSDPMVRNKVWVVEFIDPDADGSTITAPIINLVPADDADVYTDQSVVCLYGLTLAGKSFLFDGVEWIASQQKTGVNQAPLFDVFDPVGISYSNVAKYPSTTFSGTKLFGYDVGNGADDAILKFPLRYLTLSNVGDIVFKNYFYDDTFLYVSDKVSTTSNISLGFVHDYLTRDTYTRRIGWENAATTSQQYQQFTFSFEPNVPLVLDVKVTTATVIPTVKVYVGTQFQYPNSYTVTTTDNSTSITLSATAGVAGDLVEVQAISEQISKVGFYTVPINLENNPFGQNSASFTLGTIRTHYETIAENLLEFSGIINGSNNIRDLGDVTPFGLNILQQSSPVTLAGYFMRKADYNIFNSLEYNSREYEKFKALFLTVVSKNDWGTLSVSEIVTAAIEEINLGKTSSRPFYWGDMLPSGTTFTSTTTTYGYLSTPVFSTIQVYNFTSANYLGLLVYLNGELLIRNRDYVVATDGPRLTITATLAIGDVIVIQEFSNTAGSYVPNTPSKMGLYPAWEPDIYIDDTYVTPTTVIRGHDGSITVAFGDYRDDVLLDFERRIYNNIKMDGNAIPLVWQDIIPGQFRTTEYTLNEVNDILAKDFLSWVGWNKLDYKTQTYDAANQFTWNYSTAGNKLSNNAPLPAGGWRGIYLYFYDTINPNSRPWELLGFTVQPTWWTTEYGPAPWTSGNEVMWDDIAAGIVKDPAGSYVIEKYRRPDLVDVLPEYTEGQLVSPFVSVVGNYDSNSWKKSWAFGDDGPVESAWRTSSAYPFAIMRLMALTRPAEFFSLFVDRDLYQFNVELGQYLYNNRYRLDANGVQVYGDGVSKASYINWIVDYNRQSGLDSTVLIQDDLANLDVRLCYRMASFSNKTYLKLYTEKSSPNSLNSSLLLPDESYNLFLYKNVPFAELTYSSVIIQQVTDGYAVFGYSNTNPYFDILTSRPNGATRIISGGNISVTVPTEYTTTVTQVPYGYVFTNKTAVADFLLSYGTLLETQGMIFDSYENGYVLNWPQMVSEFLYWTTQGWGNGSLVNLNPSATTIQIERPGAIVDSLQLQTFENVVLDQDRRQLNTRDLVVNRTDNLFKFSTTTGQTINFLAAKFVSFEHMIVVDNTSIFADLIYQPATGARQNRLKILGSTTTDWNGQLDAQGFVLNQPNIKAWEPNRKYAKGELVEYKTYYYSAATIVQPSELFNFDDWVRSDFTSIQQGLLPNLANKSNQLANAYSIYSANLERDQDLFSYGLIGFRPRQYMASLNLDDVSQVNLYRQFLGTKGTLTSAELFTFADLGRGVAQYDIYENWAVQQGVYGANANRGYYEMQLDEDLLQSNPSIIEVIYPGGTSTADQTVLLIDNIPPITQIYKQSFKLTSTDILTTTLIPITDTALPNSGYVDINDIDITVFNIDDPVELNENIDSIGVGTLVWAAKVNEWDWNVYRVVSIVGSVTQVNSNLDGTSVVTFSNQHGLTANELVIVKYFSDEFNGTYRVISTPTVTTIVVAFTFANPQQITESGTGIPFKLESLRVAQPSDVYNLPIANYLLPGAKVWVDNNGYYQWTVLEKQNVFTESAQLNQLTPTTGSKFGSSIAQATQNLFALIGSPFEGTPGAVWTYVKTETAAYSQSAVLSGLDATDLAEYGASVTIGNQTWMAIGAPGSGNGVGYAMVVYRTPGTASFNQLNLLTPPAPDQARLGRFGESIAMDSSERWLYIGAPEINAVYAYGYVDIELQNVFYITDGVNRIFNFADHIIINSSEPQQLSVALNNKLLTYATDYSMTGTSVVFTTPPPKDLRLQISRRIAYDWQGDGSTTQFSVNEYLYSATNIYSFSVSVDGQIQRPNIDYIFDEDFSSLAPSGRDIIFFTPPPNGSFINVYTQSYFDFVTKISVDFSINASVDLNGVMTVTSAPFDVVNVGSIITGPGIALGTRVTAFISGTGATGTYQLSNGAAVAGAILTVSLPSNARFGASLSTGSNGRQLIIGAPNNSNGSDENVGSAYIIDRYVEKYIISNPNDTVFSFPSGQLIAPTTVYLNNTLLVNTANSLAGQFTVSYNILTNQEEVTILVPMAVGDVVEIETNVFGLIDQIVADVPSTGAEYSSAVDLCPNNCSLYVGAPKDTGTIPQEGTVERLTNLSRVYGTITSTIPSPTLAAGDTLRINDQLVTVPTAPNDNIQGLSDAINASGIPNVTSSVGVAGTINAGLITISVINSAAATTLNKLTVLPGLVGSAFSAIGFRTFTFTQLIKSPNPSPNALFGQSVFIDTTADNLVVGAPGGNLYRPNIFDEGETIFDEDSTTFNGNLLQSGVVYTYDYLPSAVDLPSDPGKFVFGQQVYNNSVRELDRYGYSVNYTNGALLIGAPGSDLGDSTLSDRDYGQVSIFYNRSQGPAWTVSRLQWPVVDVSLINGVYLYNRLTGAKTQFFDYFDPLQGKILGAARQNIDFIGAVDPAAYNAGAVNNYGKFWGQEHVGQIWWDTNNTRFLDPNQNDLTYAARRWGTLFPGSTIDMYQWVASTNPPANYTGAGTVKDIVSYTVTSSVNEQGAFVVTYFFWVTGLQSIPTGSKKTLSISAIASYLTDPKSSGIPYVAFLSSSATAIYNAVNLISANDTILSIEYEQQLTENNIHIQYQLIPQDRADGFLTPLLYRKLQDSFCGVDTAGNLVPDVTLTEANRYGVLFRPRQSMFADRFLALKNYIQRANAVLLLYPISETRSFELLNSTEPPPSSTSGQWNKTVANIEELGWQNFAIVPVGYKYLVLSDSSNGGFWTIYQVTTDKTFDSLLLIRVQSYDTKRFWSYIDWVQPGYNATIKPIYEVNIYSDLVTLPTVPVGASVRVNANAQNKYETYIKTATGWDRVVLQDGTIEISEEIYNYSIGRYGFDREVFDAQYFDQEPSIETRKIIQAINEQLLIGELLIERNRLLMIVFNYVLSEFQAPEWLTKTSLVDVDHTVRDLLPYQVYQLDNQEFVIDYIQEVKPYHVQVRELNLIYKGQNDYQGNLTDFDLPAYWNTSFEIPQFVSPVLTPYTSSTATGTGLQNYNSDTAITDELWSQWPYSNWVDNYTLSVLGVTIINGGTGYTSAPDITITGTSTLTAILVASINSSGAISSITILNSGAGYLTTPTIEISGGGGTGAELYPVMGNNLVRGISTTIKFDRYQYQTTLVDWEPNVNYDNGTQVRYNDRVWEADSSDSTGVRTATFDPLDWTEVPAGDLTGVDRTMGFYIAAVNEPGLDLALLVSGVDYPGVQVQGILFSQNTGFDVGNFDINPFDNLSYGPEGRPTYDPGILDTIYESDFLDAYLGNATTDINVDGGGFVDEYSSHAPEELIPGAEYDTLDLRVYTRPGSDWENDGHGFRWDTTSFVYDRVNGFEFDYSTDYVPHPVAIRVTNSTQGRSLIKDYDYVIDWVAHTLVILYEVAHPAANDGDTINVEVFGIGGGSQLYKNTFDGTIVDTVTIPVAYNEIETLVIFVNGNFIETYTYAASGASATEITFASTYGLTDEINITALGLVDGSLAYSWSAPITQYYTADGTNFNFEIDAYMGGTNPANIIVEKNGIRARPPEGIEYISDGSSAYELPTRGGYSQAIITDNDVRVWVNNDEAILNVDFIVEPYSSETDNRAVEFITPVHIGDKILLTVWTRAAYTVDGDWSTTGGLTVRWRTNSGFVPTVGDKIAITSWNDTAQQDIVTQVFVGPIATNESLTEPYDSTPYDLGSLSGDPGTYDYAATNIIYVNDFELRTVITDPSRLWVTLNGRRLFYGESYSISGTQLIIEGPVISGTAVLAVATFTQSVVPEELNFRIFQDMAGTQLTYRMTQSTTTELAASVTATADTIYVKNAFALTQPNLSNNVWGIVTINGERITYRYIDFATGAISGLRRGTAGTAAAAHAIDAIVYNIAIGNLLMLDYQDHYVENTFIASGTDVTYTATNIDLSAVTGIVAENAVQVLVGGYLQQGGYTVTALDPVVVEFDTAPAEGLEIRIRVRQGQSWYQPGVNTASDGVALQQTRTPAARFFQQF